MPDRPCPVLRQYGIGQYVTVTLNAYAGPRFRVVACITVNMHAIIESDERFPTDAAASPRIGYPGAAGVVR